VTDVLALVGRISVGPGETVTVSATPGAPFHGERLVIAPPPAPPWWRLECFVRAAIANVIASPLVLLQAWRTGVWAWMPTRQDPPDERSVVAVKVGDLDQVTLGDGPGIPAAVFAPAAFGVRLKLDTAKPGRPIQVTIRNESRRRWYGLGVAVMGHMDADLSSGIVP